MSIENRGSGLEYPHEGMDLSNRVKEFLAKVNYKNMEGESDDIRNRRLFNEAEGIAGFLADFKERVGGEKELWCYVDRHDLKKFFELRLAFQTAVQLGKSKEVDAEREKTEKERKAWKEFEKNKNWGRQVDAEEAEREKIENERKARKEFKENKDKKSE